MINNSPATILAAIVPASGPITIDVIGTDLESLKAVVNGWLEHISLGHTSGWLNEKGKILGQELNARGTNIAIRLGWPMGDVIAGTLLLTGNDGPEVANLTDPVIRYLVNAYGAIVTDTATEYLDQKGGK